MPFVSTTPMRLLVLLFPLGEACQMRSPSGMGLLRPRLDRFSRCSLSTSPRLGNRAEALGRRAGWNCRLELSVEGPVWGCPLAALLACWAVGGQPVACLGCLFAPVWGALTSRQKVC